MDAINPVPADPEVPEPTPKPAPPVPTPPEPEPQPEPPGPIPEAWPVARPPDSRWSGPKGKVPPL
jgi:hypothetical protein